jgi:hypothetical protein
MATYNTRVDPTYLLGTWVRERQAPTLEEEVRRLTSDPADEVDVL